MSLDLALRLTEVLLSFAVLQRAAEHIVGGDRPIYAPQAVCAALVLLNLPIPGLIWVLWAACLLPLWRFQGPYNGGADKMLLLVTTCLALTSIAPGSALAEGAMGYLAVQLTLSYFISGWVKIRNVEWRSGRALAEVFAYSIYPVTANSRGWSDWPRLLRAVSLAVIIFEVLFPLALVSPLTTALALALAAGFHLSNALFLGLNRFIWAWISAYPALIWAQGHFLGHLLWPVG